MTDLDDVADPAAEPAHDSSTDLEPVADSAPGHDVDDSAEARVKRRKRWDRGLLIASFVIAAGTVLIVWGFFTAITGDEGVERPEQIESVSPVENAVQVLQQEGVVVDLVFGYEAVLIIDGIELVTTNTGRLEAEPGQQLEFPATAIFDPGNAVISFTPSEDAAITEWTEGRHQARVVYWRIEDGRESSQSYTWTFDVV